MVGKKTSYAKASCSTLPVIKGISKYMTQNEWLDIAIKAHNGINPEQYEQTVIQRMGDVLEPVLLKESAEMLGLDFVKTDHDEPVEHPEIPLAGSLDGTGVAKELTFKNGQYPWLIIPEQETITLDGPGVLECKCTRDIPTNDLEEWRGVLQSKGLMECTGYNWCAVVVLWQSTDFRIYLYKRDPEFKHELYDMVFDFDNRVKQELYYPPVTSADANIVYKKVQKDDMILPGGTDAVIETIIENKRIIKDLEKTIDDAETRLKALIGDASEGKTNQYTVKWPMINYKAQPEKIIAPKDKRSVRAKTLRIKKHGI